MACCHLECHLGLIPFRSWAMSEGMSSVSSVQLCLNFLPTLNLFFFLHPVWWHHHPGQKTRSLPGLHPPHPVMKGPWDSIFSAYQMCPKKKKKNFLLPSFKPFVYSTYHSLSTASSFIPPKSYHPQSGQRWSVLKPSCSTSHLKYLYGSPGCLRRVVCSSLGPARVFCSILWGVPHVGRVINTSSLSPRRLLHPDFPRRLPGLITMLPFPGSSLCLWTDAWGPVKNSSCSSSICQWTWL